MKKSYLRHTKKFALYLFYLVAASSCYFDYDYSDSGRHAAFIDIYSRHKGQPVSKTWLARYPGNIISTTRLASGQDLIEFMTPMGEKCRVFYVVDRNQGIVLDWFFKGTETSCQWVGI